METILKILDQMIEAHQNLIQLGQDKKSVIVANEVDRLAQLTQKENKLTKLVEDLEALRIQAVHAFLRGRGLYPAGPVSISDLAKLVVKVEEKEALMSRGQQLVTLVRELKAVHYLNKQLIEHSLAYIDYSLDLFAAYPEQEATYTHPLHDQSYANRNRMFDRKA